MSLSGLTRQSKQKGTNMEMKKYKLGEIAENITDGEHGTVIDDDNGKFFLLSNKNIINGEVVITNNDRKINKTTFDKLNKRTKLEVDDILLSTVGTLGKTAIIKKEPNYIVQRSVGIIKPNKEKVSPYFLKYYFDNPSFQKRLVKLSKGAVQKCLFIGDLQNLEISLPPLATQQKIAAVLSSLDKKISLNRKINDNLEAMAKQLYDYYFVQFDFPNEQGKPYKTSGGAMVWNEKLKREIPAGWEVKSIEDVLNKYTTTKRYNTKEYLSKGKYPIVDQGDDYIVGFTNDDESVLKRHPAILFGDHSTKVKYIDFDFARGADGTQILYSNNECVSQYYLYFVVKSLEIPNPGYSRHFKYLKKLPIVIPNLEISKSFAGVACSCFGQWTKNIFQNIQLTAQRDALLPLLMNGQVSVE